MPSLLQAAMRFGQRSASTMIRAEGRTFLIRFPERNGKSTGLAIGSIHSEADFSKMDRPVEVVLVTRKRSEGLRRWYSRANLRAMPTSPTLTA